MCLFYLYATAKKECLICSNKHETCLILYCCTCWIDRVTEICHMYLSPVSKINLPYNDKRLYFVIIKALLYQLAETTGVQDESIIMLFVM